MSVQFLYFETASGIFLYAIDFIGQQYKTMY